MKYILIVVGTLFIFTPALAINVSFPYQFPPDTKVHIGWQNTKCTLPVVGEVKCPNTRKTLLNIPTGETWTILHAKLSSNGQAWSQLQCVIDGVGAGGQSIFYRTNDLYAEGFLFTPCETLVNLSFYGGSATMVSSEIYYVEYDLTAPDAMQHATSTPFTRWTQYDQGTIYSYSPFEAMIGISIIFIAIFCVIFGMAKFIESRRT